MREKTKELCRTALGAAVLCLISPWSLYLGALPITLSFFAILLISWLFEPKTAVFATLIYVALGGVGLPVFAGFLGGFQVIAGPTGGFILCYPLVALICSKFGTGVAKKLVFGIASAIFIYLIGLAWLSITTDTDYFLSLSALSPILAVFDLVKILAAAFLSGEIKKRLKF